MNKNFLTLIFILSYSGVQCSYAQPFIDIVNIKYQWFPNVKYNGEKKEVSINQIIGNINLPIPLKNKDVFITGGTYDQLQFVTSNRNEAPISLYSLLLQFGYLKIWKGKKWETLIVALPKFNSDHLTISKDSYQQGGVILFTYIKKENLKYKFGLYYSREFFGNFFMPLLGLEWNPCSRLNIFGVLPGSMNIEYQINKKIYLGTSFQSITSSYRLNNGNSSTFVRNGDRFWGHNQIRAFINFHVTKHWVLFAETGFTLWRKFEAYETKKIKLPHSIFSKSSDGMLINGGIAFRIRLK